MSLLRLLFSTREPEPRRTHNVVQAVLDSSTLVKIGRPVELIMPAHRCKNCSHKFTIVRHTILTADGRHKEKLRFEQEKQINGATFRCVTEADCTMMTCGFKRAAAENAYRSEERVDGEFFKVNDTGREEIWRADAELLANVECAYCDHIMPYYFQSQSVDRGKTFVTVLTCAPKRGWGKSVGVNGQLPPALQYDEKLIDV